MPKSESVVAEPAEPMSAADRRQERLWRLRRDLLLEQQSSTFGHAGTYAVLIIFGAYAGLFSLWSFTKDQISPHAGIWVAMLLGISMLTFVCFEIFKTFSLSRHTIKTAALLNQELGLEQLEDGIKTIRREAHEFNSMVMIPIWLPTFAVTVVTGVAAAIILMWQFAVQLVTGAS